MELEVLTAADGDGTAHILVKLVAKAAPPAERSPVHLALVIDRSSSMRGPRLEKAVRAASELAGRLGPRDRLSVVAFDAAARVIAAPTQMTGGARETLLAALSTLDTGAGTNLGAAIKRGAELLRGSFVRGALSRLVLLTDGQPSVGITSADGLGALAETECERGGVTITAMGIGESFDDDLLTEVARRGRGSFYYLAAPGDIAAAFGRELAGVFSIAAQGAVLKLVPHDSVAGVEVLHRLPSRPVEDGLSVEIGEVAGGAPRHVLFQVAREPGAGGRHLGTLTLTYRRPGGAAGDPRIVGVELPVEPLSAAAPVIALEKLRLAVARTVDLAWARRASSDADQAAAALAQVKRDVLALKKRGGADPDELAALLADVESAEGAAAAGAAERERVRRRLRERSQVTLLGHSVLAPLLPSDD